jgi:hypothetical protein
MLNTVLISPELCLSFFFWIFLVFRHSIKISHANPFSLLQHLDFCINGSGVSVVIDLKGSEHNYLKRSGVMCYFVATRIWNTSIDCFYYGNVNMIFWCIFK